MKITRKTIPDIIVMLRGVIVEETKLLGITQRQIANKLKTTQSAIQTKFGMNRDFSSIRLSSASVVLDCYLKIYQAVGVKVKVNTKDDKSQYDLSNQDDYNRLMADIKHMLNTCTVSDKQIGDALNVTAQRIADYRYLLKNPRKTRRTLGICMAMLLFSVLNDDLYISVDK